jgi:predicted  nucleic acid-binding Zn-ribbon protein
MPGKEIERVRARVAAELEREHARKTRELTDETEKAKAALSALRRDYELLNTKYSQACAERDRDRSEAETRTKESTAATEARIKTLQASVEELARSDAKAGQLRREVAQRAEREKQLLGDIDELQARLEKARQEHDAERRSWERQAAEERAAARAVQSEKETLARKAADLEQQMVECNTARAQQMQRIALMEQQAEQARARFAAATDGVRAEADAAVSAVAEERSRWRQERESLARQLDDASRRHEESTRRERELVSEQLARERQLTATMRAARDDAVAKFAAIKKQLAESEAAMQWHEQQAADIQAELKR